MLNCSLFSPKTTYLAIFTNFGQLWMVVYTAIIQFFLIFQLCWMCIGVKNFEIDPIFAIKSYSQKNYGGVTLTPPPPTWIRVKSSFFDFIMLKFLPLCTVM